MASGDQMRFHLPGWIILMLSGICFADALHLGSGVWGNPLADTWGGAMNGLVLGMIFFIHGLNTGPRRADVVVAASVFAGLVLADEHGLLNEHNPLWMVLLALVVITWFRGAWIEKRQSKAGASS
jgi:hypothetical protein